MSEGRLKHKLNLLDLTLLGVGSIIGSGWLYAALNGANVAGPHAWISWVLGAVAIILVGLVYAELGAALPRAGGFVRYPEYSHGSIVGFLIGFTSFLAYSSVVGVEVEAVRQYATFWWPGLTTADGGPTAWGFIIQIALLVLFFLLNYWSVNFFGKLNTIITIFKFIVPVLTIIILFAHMHPSNFTVGGADPGGAHGVFNALASAGIVFAFLGFRQAIDFAAEAKRPQRDIPLAIVLSVVIGLGLYILLQIAFIGAVPFDKVDASGWAMLHFDSPYADIASILGITWLLQLILWDAAISPAGTGNIFMAGAARVMFAWAKNGYLFSIFRKVDPKSGVPRAALWLSLVLSILWTLPAQFQAWGGLISAVTSAFVLTYMVGSVSLAAFRKSAPDLKRPFNLAGWQVISPLAFIAAALIAYWSGYQVIKLLVGMSIIAFIVFAIYYSRKPQFKTDMRSAWWLIAYYVGLFILSLLGDYGDGALRVIPQPWDTVIVAVFALVIYFWGANTGLEKHRITADEDEVGDDNEAAV